MLITETGRPAGGGILRVRAVHPQWKGEILLSMDDQRAVQEEHGSEGRFSLQDGKLTVYWRDYQPDHFTQIGDEFVQDMMLIGAPRFDDASYIRNGDAYLKVDDITVIADGGYRVALRPGTSDRYVFLQVLLWKEYNSPYLPAVATRVIDLGANIGLAAVFFGLHYPACEIVCVEPDGSNFALAKRNTAALGPRVRLRHGAVWINDGEINLHAQSETGSPLDQWGLQVSDQETPASQAVPCFKLTTLMDEAGFSEVDILKIDIEGAELELFTHGAEAWLSRVGLIMVETHDRFRPGADLAVRAALDLHFEELPQSGENLLFRRRAR